MEYGVHVTGMRFAADENSDVAWNRLGVMDVVCMPCDLEYAII